jgi:hypothetical protein
VEDHLVLRCGIRRGRRFHVHRDPGTGKFTILGTYNVIGAASFPIQQPLMIYLALTDGRDETPLKLRIVDVDEERPPVLEAEASLDMTDPTTVHEFPVIAPMATFPEPGEYRIQLFGAGTFLREVRLHVVPHNLPPPGTPTP